MQAKKLRNLVGMSIVSIAVAILLGMAFILEQTRNTAMETAEKGVEHTARTAENIINRHLLQADSTLARIPMVLPLSDQAGSPEERARAATRLLQNLNLQNFAFRDLLIVLPDGQVWASGRARNDRLPFAIPDVSRSLAGGASVVLGPYRHEMTGNWTWYLARTVTVARLGKVHVMAELPVDSIGTALGNILDIKGLAIRLRRPDGQLLASFPHEELLIGRQPEPSGFTFSRDVPVHRQVAQNRIEGFRMVKSTLYPDLFIEILRDFDAAMHDWSANRDRILVICAAGVGLIAGFGLLLLFLLRREERIEAERENAQRLLADAIEAMPDGFVMWSPDDRLVTCNARFKALYAISAPAIEPGALFEDILRYGAEHGQYPQAGEDIEDFLTSVTAWHQSTKGALERQLPDGTWLQIMERRTSDGGIVGIRSDITALKLANERVSSAIEELRAQNISLVERDNALYLQNMRFDATLNNLSQGLIMVDHFEKVTVLNRRFLELLGLDLKGDFSGMHLQDLLEAARQGGALSAEKSEEAYEWHARHCSRCEPGTRAVETRDNRVLHIIQRPMDDGGFVATYEDITDRIAAEKQIRFLALHDPLTHLPNRVMLRQELETKLKSRSRRPARGLALLYLDLDKFKDVNDTLGHSAGDSLLRDVADRIRGCLRKSDLVARLGGDEFAVLTSAEPIIGKTTLLAERIIQAVAEPFPVNGHLVSVGVSIGIAVADAMSNDPDTLLKNADLALYHSKEIGRGTFSLFRPEMEARLVGRLRTETELRHAVWNEQLELAYQPLVDLNASKILGFEALVRWNHPERGVVSPAEFIPLAEETGIIHDLGAWCLRRACHDIAGFPSSTKVAVNLSAIQLKHNCIVAEILAALENAGLSPSRLELEITETALLDDDERIIHHLHQLRQAGIRIVLDDFGTGYSSLNYLRRFPFNKIKIDKVFIDEATTRPDCASIITSVVDLATRLNMTTTAEGIETEAQLDLIRSLGCTEGQGYLLGKPGPVLAALARFGQPDVIPFIPKGERRAGG